LASSIIVSIGHKNAEKFRNNKNSKTYITGKEITGTAASTISLEKCVSPFLALSLNQCQYVNSFSFVLYIAQNNQKKVKHRVMFTYT
jgi:hypothetical protein